MSGLTVIGIPITLILLAVSFIYRIRMYEALKEREEAYYTDRIETLFLLRAYEQSGLSSRAFYRHLQKAIKIEEIRITYSEYQRNVKDQSDKTAFPQEELGKNLNELLFKYIQAQEQKKQNRLLSRFRKRSSLHGGGNADRI